MNERVDENTTEPLKGYENGLKNRIQFTSISVGTKDEKETDTIQLSKYVLYIQDVPKIFPDCIQMLRW